MHATNGLGYTDYMAQNDAQLGARSVLVHYYRGSY